MTTKSAKKRVPSKSRTDSRLATMPRLDKARIQEMRAMYNIFNIEKERERIRASRNRTPTQAFEAYLDLWEFGRQFVDRDTFSQKEKVASFERYYDRLKRIEAGRRVRAR